ncbi:MAG TPA: hypothetical protein H9708_03640 [Candidatus Borkfalkia stercoripullorum]|nr:hypothetical protein [Candidatus Borkfalkia stercoripullorum]
MRRALWRALRYDFVSTKNIRTHERSDVFSIKNFLTFSAYEFDEDSESWDKTYYETLEEAVDDRAEYESCFSAFTALYYDDLTKEDDYFSMTDNALQSFSSLIGYEMSSFRLNMENSRFASATAIVEFSGTRLEINYTFKNYGSTTVELPA